ncbi:hypothetical protein [Lacipirellula parvula]|uniref:Uncharacterized protein n=1 Tax=Lacipirellula parvula TaxID=2650471 RepID=A0A5K7XMS0_9BACT|nr:hypothetical protein [Lacipirellula parvula]BBO34399.1 hypothetical protein PLANPX_4011 [Lacipirellula parvula]
MPRFIPILRRLAARVSRCGTPWALAAWSLAWFAAAGSVRGEGTLLEYLQRAESRSVSPASANMETIVEGEPMPLADEIALEQPLSSASSVAEAPYYDDHEPPFGVGPEDQPSYLPGNMPINWISGPYLRYGVDFTIGEGILEGGQKLGWGINGGFRQALAPGLAPGNMFFDLGGGYLSAVGQTTRVVDGVETNTITNVKTPVADAFTVNLLEVKRASVNLALGWYWGDVVDRRGQDPRLRFATRFGGRMGSVRGRFIKHLDLVPSANSNIQSTFLNTDTFGGLLLGTEAILLSRRYDTCNILLTADVEFANDWIEFGGFDSGSLGTASLMTGFMLTR